MMINDNMRDLINRGCSSEQLRDASIQAGMKTLRDVGLEKVYSGLTSIDEIVRETAQE
jgi:type IV pilus assembly protein PilB